MSDSKDPLNSMQEFWQQFALPGYQTMQSMFSIEELDKKITDLKAVANWLNVNLGMLNAMIQGLEIQRASLAAFQAASNSHPENAANTAEASPENQTAEEKKSIPEPSVEKNWWGSMQQPFAQMMANAWQSKQNTQDVETPQKKSTRKPTTKKSKSTKKSENSGKN